MVFGWHRLALSQLGNQIQGVVEGAFEDSVRFHGKWLSSNVFYSIKNRLTSHRALVFLYKEQKSWDEHGRGGGSEGAAKQCLQFLRGRTGSRSEWRCFALAQASQHRAASDPDPVGARHQPADAE